ncbi:MAG: CoA ester lyase [Proteobacteria bacterium]|nr:CoA ester lyase [Pseudomonadota bacterium]
MNVQRPRRSLLYVPASNARALEKARMLPADGFIVDLEDAVLPDAKPAARATAAQLIRAGGFGDRELIVRVNALDTPWIKDDLAALSDAKAPAILVPKVNRPDDLLRVAGLLSDPDAVRLWAMMETPLSILHAREIAACGSPLAGFIVGTNDLAKDLRCAHPADRAPMMMALQTCVMAARAFGIAVIDGVHIDLDDDVGFIESCRASRALGFDGRSLIHPKQIAGANEAYAPSAPDIARARKIVDAHRAAAAEGKAVVVVDGRLVEFLHVREAERLLSQAEMIAALR